MFHCRLRTLKTFQVDEQNCVPLYEMMVSGTPNLEIHPATSAPAKRLLVLDGDVLHPPVWQVYDGEDVIVALY